MFTGIIEGVGLVDDVRKNLKGTQIKIDSTNPDIIIDIGGSISINGACLTAIDCKENLILVEVTNETISKTTFKNIEKNQAINLERALKFSDRLQGHIVQGHIDGVGEIVSIEDDGFSKRFVFSIPDEFLKYCSVKGSIAIDGTSLTISNILDNKIEIVYIPFTIQNTIAKFYKIGQKVNFEVDILCKHVENLLIKK